MWASIASAFWSITSSWPGRISSVKNACICPGNRWWVTGTPARAEYVGEGADLGPQLVGRGLVDGLGTGLDHRLRERRVSLEHRHVPLRRSWFDRA
jgi:hypothetical protein